MMGYDGKREHMYFSLLRLAQNIRVLEVQLSNEVNSMGIKGWDHLDEYKIRADESWAEFNHIHRELYGSLFGGVSQ